MKIHFCETIQIENFGRLRSERKERQQDLIAIFQRKLLFKLL